MTLAEVMTYTPTLLPVVVERAVEVHPNTARSLPGTKGSRLEALIERLMACPSEDAVRDFGRSLSPRDQRGLISALLRQDARLSPRIEAAVQDHLRAASLGPLWSLWQKIPGDRYVLSLLRSGSEAHGMAAAVDPAWADRVRGWIHAEPSRAILEWADEAELRLDDLGRMRGSPLQTESPLMDELWRMLLTGGTAAQIQREDAGRLRARGFAMGPEDVMAFGRHYLGALPNAAWSLPIVEDLKERFGLPGARQSRDTFWKPVSDEDRRAFRRHFLSRELERAFGSADDRQRFWKEWMDDIRDMTTGTAGQTEYAVLEFENFGVVEFFEHGNAAYFYDPEMLDQMARRSPSHPSDLKVGNDRLIHREGWQRTANRKIRGRLQWARRNR